MQRAATIPAGFHVSIVSPLVGDVRRIAVPSPIRSFETLICRLFRDGVQFCSGLVDLVVGERDHGGVSWMRHQAVGGRGARADTFLENRDPD